MQDIPHHTHTPLAVVPKAPGLPRGYLAQLFKSNVRNYNNHRDMQSNSLMFKNGVRCPFVALGVHDLGGH